MKPEGTQPIKTLQQQDMSSILAKEFDLPVTLTSLLCRRGIATVEEARHFLFPDFATLPTPDMITGMADAVEVILRACEKQVPIAVHGDYDVDGVTGTVLLVRFLRLINPCVHYYIPNRLKDSYGLSKKSVEKLAAMMPEGEGVFITVDCGITALEAVKHATSKGYKVIVTDHHQPPDELPGAAAVINPKQSGCRFPFKELAGVGVVFFLVAAIRRTLIDKGFWEKGKGGAPNLKQYLDLVSLGTVADVMPLVGVNRVLVRGGLEVMNENRSRGIASLCNYSGIHANDKITPETISFTLAPRLNAAGRMGEVDHAVELLLTDTPVIAKQAAEKLNDLNTKRRQLEQKVLGPIFEMCTEEVAKGRKGLAIYSETCHAGILGIVASRIADKFEMPAIVFTIDNEEVDGKTILKGSGRSVEGIDLYGNLKSCTQYIRQFGGHRMAVGLTVFEADLMAFRQQFDDSCQSAMVGVKSEKVKIELPMHDKVFLNNNFLSKMQFLQPFGEGNPEPLFHLKKEQLKNVKKVKDHLTFTLDSPGRERVSGIGFFMADKLPMVKNGPVDIAFKFKRAYFRGIQRLEIQIVGLEPSVM